MKAFTLAISTAALLAVSAAHGSWSQYSCEKELLSYQLPSAWQVQNEQKLEKIGYLSAPYPAYTLIAGAEPARWPACPTLLLITPYRKPPRPWFMVLVETATSPAPSPATAYELAPEGEVTLLATRTPGLSSWPASQRGSQPLPSPKIQLEIAWAVLARKDRLPPEPASDFMRHAIDKSSSVPEE